MRELLSSVEVLCSTIFVMILSLIEFMHIQCSLLNQYPMIIFNFYSPFKIMFSLTEMNNHWRKYCCLFLRLGLQGSYCISCFMECCLFHFWGFLKNLSTPLSAPLYPKRSIDCYNLYFIFLSFRDISGNLWFVYLMLKVLCLHLVHMIGSPPSEDHQCFSLSMCIKDCSLYSMVPLLFHGWSALGYLMVFYYY